MAIPALQSVRQKITGVPNPAEIPVPKDVQKRSTRASERIDRGAPLRNLCSRFYRNQQYQYINEAGMLNEQPTVTYVSGGGKPKHRVRTTRNIIMPIVNAKVSAATQRVPSYEINPSSFDPDRVAAASLAEKVALYGYDHWKLRRVIEKVVTLALVADEGFAWPFWDSSIGPFAETEFGTVGMGDVRVRVLSRNEVGWEPGLDFDESPYWIVKQGRPLEEVYQMHGYLGGELKPDATMDTTSAKRQQSSTGGPNLVLVTDYLERPCAKFPNGRWITIANGRVIAGVTPSFDPQTGPALDTRPYPLTDADGKPVDEPCLHRLSYITDPDSDEDLGLVRFLIDVQRSYNDVNNKILEWKNRCLNPQILAPAGSLKTRPDDTPGAIIYFNPVGNQIPQWQKTPDIPETLFTLANQIRQDAIGIAQSQDPPEALAAGEAMQVYIEQRQSQWQNFLARLSDFHSAMMRHCLYLVARHYTEPRVLKVRGRSGWENPQSFLGADLMTECDCRVFPGSIEALTHEMIEKRLAFLVQNFPGQITKEQAMAALERGTAEELIKGYELDIARANRVIQKIKAGPDSLFEGDRIDPNTGQEIPAFMPRPFDNLAVHEQVFSDFLKSDEYETLPVEMQEAANQYYEGIKQLQAEQQAQQAAQMNAMAQGLGMSNAARPQGLPPTPVLGSKMQNLQMPQGGNGAQPGQIPSGPAPNNT